VKSTLNSAPATHMHAQSAYIHLHTFTIDNR